MKTYPVALTIAGSDSSSGAGIQADIKTFSALGVFGTSAITAITSQNTTGVREVFPIDAKTVVSQIRAVMEDFNVGAIKTGMLFSEDIITQISAILDKKTPIIVDPVMIATSGNSLVLNQISNCIIDKLFSIASILTPNLNETSCLLNKNINCIEDMQRAAKEFVDQMGVKAVLIKGGHLNNKKIANIFYEEGDKETRIRYFDKIDSKNTHGTGCTLSSAIAAFIAIGYDLKESVIYAEDYIHKAIIEGKDIKIGNGHGPVNHFFNPQKLIIR